jgi:hypothetical protein
MQLSESIQDFYLIVQEDPRISPVHISLYMALVELWIRKEYATPFLIFSHDVMPLAKISGVATYFRTIRELNDFGYISYSASFNRFEGSSVVLMKSSYFKNNK